MNNLKKFILFVSILAGFIPVLFFLTEFRSLMQNFFYLSFSIANGCLVYFVVCKALNLLLKNSEDKKLLLLPLIIIVTPLIWWFLFINIFSDDTVSYYFKYNLYEPYNFLFVGVGLLSVALAYGSILSIRKRIKQSKEGTANIEEYSTRTLVNKVGAWVFVSSATYFMFAIAQTGSGEESIGLIFLYPLVFLLFLFSLPFLIYLIRKKFIRELRVLVIFQVGLFIFLLYVIPDIHQILSQKDMELYEQSPKYKELMRQIYREGESSLIDSKQTNLSTPKDLSAKFFGGGTDPFVQLTFDYLAADYFNIYRSINPDGPWELISPDFPSFAHSLVDYNFPKNAEALYYRIAASDGRGGEGPYSPVQGVNIFSSEAQSRLFLSNTEDKNIPTPSARLEFVKGTWEGKPWGEKPFVKIYCDTKSENYSLRIYRASNFNGPFELIDIVPAFVVVEDRNFPSNVTLLYYRCDLSNGDGTKSPFSVIESIAIK